MATISKFAKPHLLSKVSKQVLVIDFGVISFNLEF